ncbi:hypothetical protein DFH28DRAFT_983712 [Melampsora americana]|nr:hypothetical protein DFH28DRAFT_983712 [Melampsora americana]
MNPLRHLIIILLCIQQNRIFGHFPMSKREEFATAIHSKEIFKPMRPSIHYNQKGLSTPSTATFMSFILDQKQERIKKISCCKPLLIYLHDQGCGNCFLKIANALPTILKSIEKENEIFENTIISLFISHLNRDNLTPTQRIVHLTVLWAFLEDSPLWVLELIGTKIEHHAVSRAVLELSLTKDFDLFSKATEATKSSIIDAEVYPAWLEGLQRVDLLDHIRRNLLESPQPQPSESLMAVYDLLIKSNGKIEENIVKEITLSCINIIEKEKLKTEKDEWHLHYNILEHLVKFCPSSRRILEYKSSQNFALKGIIQKISRWIALRQDIDSFSSSHKVDPYISNLLLPFSKHKPVNLDHYRYIIDEFEIQEGAQETLRSKSELEEPLKPKVGEGGGLLHENGVRSNHEGAETQDSPHLELEHLLPAEGELETYQKDKVFLIKILYKASPDIMGAKELLDSKLEKEGDEYRLKNPQRKSIQDPHGADCAVCLSEFFLGQRAVRLDCSGGHTYHYTCFKKFEEKKAEIFTCPKCRKHIQLPLSIRQHIFWTGDEKNSHQAENKAKRQKYEDWSLGS